ncbi:MAG: lytic transglycosylase domain-containing protein [Candidatus Binatia bacterium]
MDNFHIGRYRWPSFGLALTLLVLVVLNPMDPMNGEIGHLIEQTEWTGGIQIEETVKIYSVLKSHRNDLDESSAWTIAKTTLEESKKHSLDPMLVLAIIKVESRFQHLAVSPVGARGLMQIRPFVASALVPEVDLETWHGIESLDDPVLNIKIGVFYLSRLKKRFRDMKLTLTAYNWGPTKIRNRLAEKGVIPLGYAMKVLSTYRFYSQNPPENP